MTAWVLRTDVALDEANLHLAALEEAGLLGLAEERGRASAYFPRRVAGLPLAGRWEQVPDRDWSEAWKRGLEPVTVGAVTVSPPWQARPGDIVVEPGQAFGTGHHETTAACLAALQELPLAGRRVLDVGTGTGLLAVAAARLGAGEVVAVDPDPQAVAAARACAEANGVSIDVREGSVAAVDGPFDVVVANLDTATVTALAADLATLLEDRGTLVVAGVSRERADEAEAALAAAGLATVAHPGREWTRLVCRPKAKPRRGRSGVP